MEKSSSRYARRKSYSTEESLSLFKPQINQKPKLGYSQEDIALNLDVILIRDSSPLDFSLADKINHKPAKQKKTSNILDEWQKKIRSSSLTSMPILEEDEENDKGDDESAAKILCCTLK